MDKKGVLKKTLVNTQRSKCHPGLMDCLGVLGSN